MEEILKEIPEESATVEAVIVSDDGTAVAVEAEIVEVDWLAIARDSYEYSTDFLNKGIRTQWDKNYKLAASKHPAGSKYLDEAYEKRSKLFRPKTAVAIEQRQAAFDVAMFSNQDVLHVSPENSDIKEQVLAAELLNKLTAYSLEHDIPWFRISMGAHKEAETVGHVVSRQSWMYEEGVIDQPSIEIIPPENVRLHPKANWLDPINSSPYLILLIPMIVADVKDRMGKDWIELSDSDIKSAVGQEDRDSTDTARRGSQADDDRATYLDHQVVWVHEVFLRYGGEELVYYTLAGLHLLSEPVAMSEIYPHTKITKKRPCTFGISSIEAHTLYPQGLPERVEGSQELANDIVNERRDNVRLVTNKRYLMRQGSEIDYRSLAKSTPGGVVMGKDISEASIRELKFSDVTGAAYQEQFLVNNDFDELAGTFSQSSVSANRTLNETVGGMKMLQGNSNSITEHHLRIFVSTWVEPVLRDLVALVQMHTDNDRIQIICGKDFNTGHLQQKCKVRVNVGFGATDPQKRVEKLVYGLGAVAKFIPTALQKIDAKEVTSEVFGALGWQDGDRFFPNDVDGQITPVIQEMQQKLQEMQRVIDTEQVKYNSMAKIKLMEAQSKERLEMLKRDTKLNDTLLTLRAKMQEVAAKLQQEKELAVLDASIGREESTQKRGIEENRVALEAINQLSAYIGTLTEKNELSYKMRTGNDGI